MFNYTTVRKQELVVTKEANYWARDRLVECLFKAGPYQGAILEFSKRYNFSAENFDLFMSGLKKEVKLHSCELIVSAYKQDKFLYIEDVVESFPAEITEKSIYQVGAKQLNLFTDKDKHHHHHQQQQIEQQYQHKCFTLRDIIYHLSKNLPVMAEYLLIPSYVYAKGSFFYSLYLIKIKQTKPESKLGFVPISMTHLLFVDNLSAVDEQYLLETVKQQAEKIGFAKNKVRSYSFTVPEAEVAPKAYLAVRSCIKHNPGVFALSSKEEYPLVANFVLNNLLCNNNIVQCSLIRVPTLYKLSKYDNTLGQEAAATAKVYTTVGAVSKINYLSILRGGVVALLLAALLSVIYQQQEIIITSIKYLVYTSSIALFAASTLVLLYALKEQNFFRLVLKLIVSFAVMTFAGSITLIKTLLNTLITRANTKVKVKTSLSNKIKLLDSIIFWSNKGSKNNVLSTEQKFSRMVIEANQRFVERDDNTQTG